MSNPLTHSTHQEATMQTEFTVEPTGSFINTRHGAQSEYVMCRNGVALFRSTQADCESQMALRIKTGLNPLAGIGGEIR